MKINERITDMIRNKKTRMLTLPVIVENILSIAKGDDTSAKDLAEFVSKDQAITNKILRLANSAYYGMMREIDSIPRAITIIGFNEVISLTVGMGVISAFRQKNLREILDMRGLWLHSIGCAFIAKKMAKKMGLSAIAEQVFLNGLLHDTGKVIFALYFPDEYRVVLEEAQKSETELGKMEKNILSMDHATLSGLLMERWHFPDNLILPSRFHHDPDKCPDKFQKNAFIVKFADYLCQKADLGYSGNPVIPGLGRLKDYFGLHKSEIESYIEELKAERPKIETFFEIIS